MAVGSLVIVTGIKEIDRRLRKLEPAVQRKVTRQAIRKGLRPVMAAVKAEAPVDTGVLKGNVKIRAARRRKRGTIEIEVRIEANEQTKKTSQTGKTVFYPAIVEYGKKGTPPNPFMRRAYEATGEQARKIIQDEMRSGIEREARGGNS